MPTFRHPKSSRIGSFRHRSCPKKIAFNAWAPRRVEFFLGYEEFQNFSKWCFGILQKGRYSGIIESLVGPSFIIYFLIPAPCNWWTLKGSWQLFVILSPIIWQNFPTGIVLHTAWSTKAFWCEFFLGSWFVSLIILLVIVAFVSWNCQGLITFKIPSLKVVNWWFHIL